MVVKQMVLSYLVWLMMGDSQISIEDVGYVTLKSWDNIAEI